MLSLLTKKRHGRHLWAGNLKMMAQILSQIAILIH